MKIPTPLDAETEAGLFLEITSLARRRAEKIVGKEAAQDIARTSSSSSSFVFARGRHRSI